MGKKFNVNFNKHMPRFSWRKCAEAQKRRDSELDAMRIVMRDGKLITLMGWEPLYEGDVVTCL